MIHKRASLWGLSFLFASAVVGSACGSGDSSTFNGGSGDDASASDDGSGSFGDGSSFGDGAGGDASQVFDVTPQTTQTITVNAGQSTPTITYKATLNGAAINAGWQIDRGDIGTIPGGPSSSAIFTPSGTAGGVATIRAGVNGQIVMRQVMVQLAATQNGANTSNTAEQGQIPANVAALSAGGGVGGVGGEGLGPAVSDAATITALGNPQSTGATQKLGFLYPYEKTMWPRGQRAPLLMWSSTLGDADAIRIELHTTSGSFAYTGTFGRPAILSTTGGKFIRHPIPQDVWDMATNTAGAPTLNGAPDALQVKLTIALGGQAYGPIVENWSVAPAHLSGTVYYNSYGTHYVKNWTATDKSGHPVGAAILGIRSGDLGPTLVVGKDSPLNGSGIPTDDSGCRVCHIVSSRGRWLISQSEQGTPGDGRSFLYDLTAPNVQASAVTLSQEGYFAWAAMTNDGAYAFTNTVDPSSTNPAIGQSTSSFWQFGTSPAAATLNGLPAGLAAGYPAFSPDNTKLAYIDLASSRTDVHGPLKVADYNATSKTISNIRTLATPTTGQRIGYPSFLPDNSGIVFETEVRPSKTDSVMVTRDGTRSEVWWVSLASGATPVRLDAANGRGASGSYLPVLPNNHGIAGATDPRSSYDETGQDDTTLSYEPTVLPIAVGGYAWVVFTSRRAYGNQLGAVPWQSWPPDYNTQDLSVATVKKLYVAAIDLGAAANADPSHPAFYLPAQEILAGNSRGFWVLDPCKADGLSCQTGDQCCNGYCEPNGEGGALVCSNAPPNATCAKTQEKCDATIKCCDPTQQCINGFCAQVVK